MAGCYVGVFEPGGLVVQVQRRGGQPDERPDGHTDAHCQLGVLPLLGQGVGHHPVPLHAEAGDEKHRAVHVTVEEAHKDFAQRLPVNPVVAVKMVGYFQRNPDDKEQVCQSEVGHVDGGRMLLLGPEEEDPNGHAIGREPDNKHNNVQDWDEDGGESTPQRFSSRLVHRNQVRVFRVLKTNKRPSFT